MPIEDFRRIVESLKLAVAIADPRGGIVFGNTALAQLLGIEPKRVGARKLHELFARGDQKRVQQNVERVAEGKSGASFLEAELAAQSRAPQWVQVALQPAYNKRDEAAGVIAVLRDIADQRAAEEALDLVSARLLALAEGMPVAAMVETAAGDVELANEAFCRWLAIDSAPESLSGVAVRDALARSPFVEPRALDAIKRHPGKRARLRFTTRDGLEVELERRPLVVDDAPAGAVWCASELPARPAPTPTTARKAAHASLVEKVGAQLSEALEGMSALAQRARQMDLHPDMVAQLESMRASTRAAMAAMDELVDFSAVSGALALEPAPFGLRAAIAELIERVVPAAEEAGCHLRVKVEQDVADRLEGDAARLQLALKNLLDNAFLSLPGTEVALQVTPQYVTESGIELQFEVVAAGPEAVFARTPTAPDAGIGIALARSMVAAMGGTLQAAAVPQPHQPLYSFTVRFPLLPAQPAPRRPTYVSLVGLTVLIASADPAQRQALASLLRGWRMVPLEADNATMALALLERLAREGAPAPLVILSDRLPTQDGWLLAFRIRHHPRLSSTLVMMLAAEGKPGDALACRENGIAAYMRYPINDRQLNEAIVAVTGASVDADETPTLVTRHSLREQRKGATVLLVDPSRDSQILAAHILGRQDCSLVVANDLEEATAALDQDLYDVVVIDTGLPGLEADDAAHQLRMRIPRDPATVTFVAASLDHSPAWREHKTRTGFNATIAKPFRREELIALLEALAGRDA